MPNDRLHRPALERGPLVVERHPRGGHLPALDGLRGLAIIAVIVCHVNVVTGGPFAAGRITGPLSTVFAWGWVGVNLFFVLSGFLITGILYDAKGSVGFFRNFYARRALRIMPLYYGFLFCIVVMNRLHCLRAVWLSPEGLASLASYTYNFRFALTGHGLGDLHHFWSLAVEEHFYLLWPQIFVWVRNRRLLMYLCFVTALIEFGWRIVGATRVGYLYVNFSTETNAAAILIGCGLALLLWFEPFRLPSFCLHPVAGAISIAGVLALAQTPENPQIRWAIPAAIPLAAIIVLQAVTYEWRILENPVARFLGQISYAIYLWGLVAKEISRGLGDGSRQVVLLLSVVAIATISHYLVEAPAQALGRRLLAGAKSGVTPVPVHRGTP